MNRIQESGSKGRGPSKIFFFLPLLRIYSHIFYHSKLVETKKVLKGGFKMIEWKIFEMFHHF